MHILQPSIRYYISAMTGRGLLSRSLNATDSGNSILDDMIDSCASREYGVDWEQEWRSTC